MPTVPKTRATHARTSQVRPVTAKTTTARKGKGRGRGKKLHKFQMLLEPAYMELVAVLTEKTGLSASDVGRQALRFYGWLIAEYERGNEILAQPKESGTNRPGFVLAQDPLDVFGH